MQSSLMILGQVMTGLNQFWTNAGSIREWRAWWAKERNEGRELLAACLSTCHNQEVESRIPTWAHLAPKPISLHLALIISENWERSSYSRI